MKYCANCEKRKDSCTCPHPGPEVFVSTLLDRDRFYGRKVKFMHGLDGKSIIVRVYQTVGGPPYRILLDAPLDPDLPDEIQLAIRKHIGTRTDEGGA